VYEFEPYFSSHDSDPIYILVLTQAVNSTSLLESQRIVTELQLAKKRLQLVEAQKVAQRRSGARGKDARAVELQAEADVAEVEKASAPMLVYCHDASLTHRTA
jgi:hypothetical protein